MGSRDRVPGSVGRRARVVIVVFLSGNGELRSSARSRCRVIKISRRSAVFFRYPTDVSHVFYADRTAAPPRYVDGYFSNIFRPSPPNGARISTRLLTRNKNASTFAHASLRMVNVFILTFRGFNNFNMCLISRIL